MSPEINIRGKKFISTKAAAELCNYHSDYIGELARGGKVLAKRVGKRWFVEKQSLLKHLDLDLSKLVPQTLDASFQSSVSLPAEASAQAGSTPDVTEVKTSGVSEIPPRLPIGGQALEKEGGRVFEAEDFKNPSVHQNEPLPLGKGELSPCLPSPTISPYLKRAPSFLKTVAFKSVAGVLVTATISGTTLFVSNPQKFEELRSSAVSAVVETGESLALLTHTAISEGVDTGHRAGLAVVKRVAESTRVSTKEITEGVLVVTAKLLESGNTVAQKVYRSVDEARSHVRSFALATLAQSEHLSSFAAVFLSDAKERVQSWNPFERMALATYRFMQNGLARVRTLAKLSRPDADVAVVPTASFPKSEVATSASGRPSIPVGQGTSGEREIKGETGDKGNTPALADSVSPVTPSTSSGQVNLYVTTAPSDTDEKLAALEQRLAADIASVRSQTGAVQRVTESNTTYITNVNQMVAGTNNLDQARDLRLYTPTITDGTITNSIVENIVGTFTALSGGSLSLTGSAQVAGDLTVYGTLTPAVIAATSSISAPYFTATSTTATSTYAGGLAIQTDKFVVESGSGNVGLGTTSPAAKLSIAGNSNSSSPLFLISTSTASATSTALIVTSSGNVGIGSSTPSANFSVAGNAYISGTLTANSFSALSAISAPYFTATDASATSTFAGRLGIATTSPSSTLSVQGSSYISGLSYFGGAITATSTFDIAGIITSTATAANIFPYASTTALTVSGTGGLYVGTLTGILQGISGAVTASSTLSTFYGGTGSGLLGANMILTTNASGNVVASSTPTAAYYLATSSIASIFPYASSTALSVSGTGYFGTASTTNLTVSALTTTRIPFLTTAGAFTDDGDLTFTSGNLLNATYASSTSLTSTGYSAFATASGNVGIGTTSPTSKLVVSGAVVSGEIVDARFTSNSNSITAGLAGITGQLIDTTGIAQGRFHLAVSAGAGAGSHLSTASQYDTYLTTSGSNGTLFGSLLFAVGNSEKMRIASTTGYVGIGTTTPSKLLSVHGDALISGNLSVAGIIATSSTITFSGLGTNMLASINGSGNLVATSTPTAAYYLATSSIASVFPYASTTALTVSGTSGLYVGTLTGPLQAINGAVTASSTLSTFYGGTGSGLLGANMLLTTNAAGNVVASSTPTAAYYLATSSIASIFPYASTTVLTVSGTGYFGTASTTNLTVSSLTSTRIPFLTTAGAFTDDGDLTFTSGNLLNATYASTTFLTTSAGATFATVSGNVGIGTTSPYAKFALHALTGDTQTGPIFDVSSSTPTATTSLFAITRTGNVGIGTTSPTQLLSVSSSGGNSAYFAGNVGIGTNSPLAPLQVAGSQSITWGAGAEAGLTGTVNIGTGGATGGSLVVRTPGDSGYASGLGIDGTLASQISTINIKAFGVNFGGFWGSKLAFWTSRGTDLVQRMTIDDNGLVTMSYNASTTQLTTTGSTYLATTGGNVGIGTTSPANLLSVQGSGYISSNLFVGGTITSTSSLPSTIPYASTTAISISSLASGRVPYATTGGQLIDSAALTFDGTLLTSTPGYGSGGFKMAGGGIMQFFDNVPTELARLAGAAGVMKLSLMQVGGTFAIKNSSDVAFATFSEASNNTNLTYASTTALSSTGGAWFATSGGNVGIGTTVPLTKFDVSGGGAGGTPYTDVRFDLGTTNVSKIILGHVTGLTQQGYIAYDVSSNFMTFGGYENTGGTNVEKMRITQTGNVGIGTTVPGQELHVVGQIVASSTYAGLISLNADVDEGKFTSSASDGSQLSLIGTGANATGASLVSFKSRTTSETGDANTAVTSGDDLFALTAKGADGANYVTSAQIKIGTEGTIGSGRVPSYIKFITGTDAATTVLTERMRITAAGNVGIGTDNPQSPLTIASSTLRANAILSLESNLHTANGDYSMIQFGDQTQPINYHKGALIYENRDGLNGAARGNMHIALNSANDSTNVSISDAKLTVQYGGNVGIGTTGPGAKLHLNRDDTTRTDFFIENNDLGANQEIGIIRFDALDDGSAAQNYAAVTGMISSAAAGAEIGRIDFETAVAGSLDKRVSIVGGNVGIGTVSPDSMLSFGTTNPTITADTTNATDNALFQIGGGGGVGTDRGAYINLMGNEYSTTGGQLDLLAGAVNATGVIRLITNTTERMRVDYNGNVGIGTTTPGASLHVQNGSSGLSQIIVGGGGDNYSALQLKVGSSFYNWIAGAQYNVSNAFEITPSTAVNGSTFSTPAMVVLQTGNVGIGTTSPVSVLSVQGSSGGDDRALLKLTNTSVNSDYAGGISFFHNDATYSNPFTTSMKNFQGTRGGDFIENDFMAYIGEESANTGGLVVVGASNGASTVPVDITGVFGTAPSPVTSYPAIALNANKLSGSSSGNLADTELILGVANNQSLKMVVQGSGNVGIGTTSPKMLFHVEGANPFSGTSNPTTGFGSLNGGVVTNTAMGADVGPLFGFGGQDGTGVGVFSALRGAKENASASDNGGYLAMYTLQNGVALAERMRVTGTGNVGIGTTTPWAPFVIANGGGGRMVFNDALTTHYNWMLGNNVNINNGFELTPSTAVGGYTFSTPGLAAVVVSDVTRIGIGDSGPDFKLETVGSAGSGYFGVTNSTDGDIFIVNGDGNVGIGDTTPGLRAEIKGVLGAPATSGTTQTGIARFSQAGGSLVLDFGVRTAPDVTWLQSVDANDLSTNYPLVLNPNGGNVGIGTVTPLAPLHVSLVGTNSKNEIATILESTGGDLISTPRGVGLVFKDASNPTLVAGIVGLRLSSANDYNGDLAFFTNNSGGSAATTFAHMTERMRILASGNVGIGDTTPSYLLEVAGTANVTGTTTIQGLTVGKGMSALSANTVFGVGAGASFTTSNNNIAIGTNALAGAIATGDRQVAIGTDALKTADNYLNIGIGYLAGNRVTSGASNTIVGGYAGTAITTGINNVFIGESSGGGGAPAGSLTGEGNTAVGQSAMGGGGSSATGNSVLGQVAGSGITSGSYNTLLGKRAGLAVTTGGNNVMIGSSGDSDSVLSTGGKNTFVGWNAGWAVSTGSYNTILGGYVGTAAMANNIVLSDGQGNDRLHIDANGNVGIGTTTPLGKLDVSGDIRSIASSLNASNGLEYTSLEVQKSSYPTYSGGGRVVFANMLNQAGSTYSGSILYSAGSTAAATDDTRLMFSATTAMTRPTDNTMPTGSQMVLTYAGNVGIGTTTPNAKLQVGYNHSTAEPLITMASNGPDYDSLGTISTNEMAVQPYTYFHVLRGYAYTSSNRKFNTSDYMMTIDNANVLLQPASVGNVGIGTTAPTQGRLHITSAADIALSGTAWRVLQVESTSGAVADKPGIILGFDTAAGGVIAAKTDGVGQPMAFWTYNGSAWGERMRISKEGNVGIGTTTPGYKLNVYGGNIGVGGDSDLGIYFRSTNNSPNLLWAWRTTAGNMHLQFQQVNSDTFTSATTALTVTNGGNVGIGTTSPANTLHVYSGSNTKVIVAGDTGATAGFEWMKQGAAKWDAYVPASSNDLRFYDGSDRVTFQSGGNVGIGTTSPNGIFVVDGGLTSFGSNVNIIAAASNNVGFKGGNVNLTGGASAAGSTDGGNVVLTGGYGPGGGSVGGHILLIPGVGTGANGKVGIATTSPVSTLSVQGSLCVRDTGSCGTTAGTIYATTVAITDIDLAENYQTNDATLSPGELVSLDPLNPVYIKRANRADATPTVGVISTAPGLLLGKEISSSKPVALSGRVPVKVNDEGGAIVIGDRIALSSVAGVGKRALSGETIGIALEPFDAGSGQGVIEVFVNLRNHIDPTVFSITASSTVSIGTETPDTSYALYVNGDAAATSFVNISTRDAKKDIEYYDDNDKKGVLEKLKNVGVATYYYKSESCMDGHHPTQDGAHPAGCQKRLGLIAEEAPKEVLSANGKGVDVYKLATFILAGVQEQQKQLESLKLRVDSLEALIASSTSNLQLTTGNLQLFTDYLAGLGAKFTNGLAEFKNVVVEKLTAKNIEVSEGITMKDKTTGAYYCVIVDNGVLKNTAGACGSTNTTTPAEDGHPSSTEEGTGSADITPPVITVNGNNPAEIQKNSVYADLGATVTDNVSENLGVHLFLNGTAVMAISLDTSSSTTYTIDYVASDGAGNTATSTRQVIVSDDGGTSGVAATPDVEEPEPTATSTPAEESPSEPATSASGSPETAPVTSTDEPSADTASSTPSETP